MKRNKNKISLKQRLKKLLAILLVFVTFGVVEPALVDVINNCLKRAKADSFSNQIDDNILENDFLDEFINQIDKNDQFFDFEKDSIIGGFSKYLSDWGYLLDDLDKQYMLYLISNMRVNRGAILPPWAIGSYFCSNITTIYGTEWAENYLDLITHEAAHGLSDRGILVGPTNGLVLGYATGEGINTSVNSKYYNYDLAYDYYRYQVLRMALLVDNEVLMNSYQKFGINYLISNISKSTGVSEYVASKFIAMLDIRLFIGDYLLDSDVLLEYFDRKIDKVYNVIFKTKYGYDFSESLLANIKLDYCNFLDEQFYIHSTSKNSYSKNSFTRIDLAEKESSFERISVENMEEFTDRVVKDIFSLPYSGEYKVAYLKIIENMLSDELISSYRDCLNLKYFTFNDNYFRYLYYDTDFCFEEFSFYKFYNYPDLCEVSEYFYEKRKSDNYLIDSNGFIVLSLKSDEVDIALSAYDGEEFEFFDIRYLEYWHKHKRQFDSFFGEDAGTYYYAKLNVDEIDEGLLNIVVNVPLTTDKEKVKAKQ